MIFRERPPSTDRARRDVARLGSRWCTQVALVVLLVPACGETTTTAADGGNRNVSPNGGGTCLWPTRFDPQAGSESFGTGVCAASRSLLSCTTAGGGGMCVTNDAGQHPECAELGSGYACSNKCSNVEYAVLCQGFEEQAPLHACRLSIAGPEQTFFCCTCEDGGT